MEEDFKRHFLGLERRISRMQHHSALVPASPQTADNGVGVLVPEMGQKGFDQSLNETRERNVQPTHGNGGFRGGHFGKDRVDRSRCVVKADFCRLLIDAVDRADTVLRMLDTLTDRQVLDFHSRRPS